MNAQTLLEELEPLTNAARVLRMIDLGRRAVVDRPAAAVLDALRASDDAYARRLALHAVHGSRDAAAVLAALDDPSRTVRRLAVGMIPLVSDDAQAARALELVAERGGLLPVVRALRKQKRLAPIDAYVSVRLAAGDCRALDILPFASEPTVRAHLAQLPEAGPEAWRRLAWMHAGLAAGELGRLLEGGGLDPRVRWRLGGVLSVLAWRAPDETLELVRALLRAGEPATGLPRLALPELVSRRPCEVFDLLRELHERSRPMAAPGVLGVVRFDGVAHRLGPERLAFLVCRAYATLSDGRRAARWFLRVSERDRAAVIEAWLADGRGAFGAFLLGHVEADGPRAAERERAYRRWSYAAQNNDGIIPHRAIEALPRDLRAREARRHLHEVAWLRARPRERMAYAAHLPFDEAKRELEPWLGHPEGAERAAALAALIATASHDRARIADVLALARARKYEQDPVRMATIGALAALPVGCFDPAHLEDVGVVVRDALDAADLSYGTAAQVERLVVRLFRVDAGWGAAWLTRLLATRGSVSAPGLAAGLRRAEVERLAPVIAGLCETWATRERAGALIWLAAGFGKRLALVEPLLAVLETLAREQPFVHVAAAALRLLRRHAGARFAALVPDLVRDDPSSVIVPEVARHLSFERQDLLELYLSGWRVEGRFATGRATWIIDFGGGYVRWTSSQHARYAAGVSGVIADPKCDTPSARRSIELLRALAFAPARDLIAFASDARPFVREMAVRALPWLDAGQGLVPLIECLGDDRARWAIYALRKALAEQPQRRVIEILRSAPRKKVTVAKEVVRLLGEIPSEEAFRDLVAMDAPALHRDVRIALLRALWSHLEREEAWAIFARAARDPDWVLASRLADVPLARLSDRSEARVTELLASVLARPEPEARLELLGRVAYVPLRDATRSLFGRLLEHVGSEHPSEATAALSAVLARMQPREAPLVIERVRELAPRRRTLAALLEILTPRMSATAPEPIRAIGEGVLQLLLDDPLAIPEALRLASRLLGWRALAETLTQLAERQLLHADATAEAKSAVSACVHPELLEAALATSPDPNLRRLALAALVRAAGPDRGWTPERRARLTRFRADPHPLVAGAAAFVFPPE